MTARTTRYSSVAARCASASATGVSPTIATVRAWTNGSMYTSTAPFEPQVIGTTTSAPAASDISSSGRIETSRGSPAASAASAWLRTTSREHEPPTKPSMTPSSNTIARSPMWDDTGPRRETTVAIANAAPSRRSAATRSKNSSMPAMW